MAELRCPGCGSGVDLDFDVACVTVCSACLKVLERSDVGLKALGTLGPLRPTRSRLKVGMRGRYDLQFFTVMGRVQLTESSGNVWDEWYAAFDGGKWGWLFDDAGRIHLSIAQEKPGRIPRFESLQAGTTVTLGDKTHTIVEVDVASAVAAEGEIPFRLDPGENFPFADLSSEGGGFGTIDYSFDPPRVYLGRELSANAFVLDTALDTSMPDDPPKRTATDEATVACPKCAKPVRILAAGETVRVVCGACRTLCDVSIDTPPGRRPTDPAPSARLTVSGQAPHLNVNESTMALPLGAKGTLRGEALTLLGFRVRSVRKDGVRYGWQEYLLHGTVGFRFLDCANGHFTLGRTVAAGDVRVDGGYVRHKGQRYERFSVGRAQTDDLIGEWPWRVDPAAQEGTTEYVSPPFLLAQETSAGEVDWTLSEHITHRELAAGFPGFKAPAQRGVGAAEPFAHAAVPRLWLLASAALVAIFLASTVTASHKVVLQQRVEIPPLSTPGASYTVNTLSVTAPPVSFPMPPAGQPIVVTSEPFEVRGNKNLAVSAVAGVDNSWLFAAGQFLNEDSGDLQPFSVEVGYYHGTEGGEDWTEGSTTAGTRVSAMPEGSTRLQLEIERDPADVRPVTLDIEVVEDDPDPAYVLIGLILLGIPGVLVWMIRSGFERRRWEDSDFPKGGKADD